MSQRRQHSLVIEVLGRHNDKRVVTRRSLDGAFECTCPWYTNRKTECHHIREVRSAVAGLMPQPDLSSVVEKVVREHPLFIGEEDRLIRRLKEAVSK